MFFMTLLIGTMLTLSSNSWLGIWMGMEINALSFVPLLMKNTNKYTNEASIKYFIIQALASCMLLISILLTQMKIYLWEMNFMSSLIITSSLLLKIGAAPFHLWFIEVMMNSSWMNCMLLMTWQKIAPMVVMSYSTKMNYIMLIIIILCNFIGAINGLNETSMKKVMGYSSVSHMGWMIMSMLMSESLWMNYLIVYSTMILMLTMLFNQNNILWLMQIFNMKFKNNKNMYLIIMMMLSMGGLPPFIGFLPKWMTMQLMMEMNLLMMTLTMTFLTMITLYYYMRISMSCLIMLNTENKWISLLSSSKKNNIMSLLLMSSLMILMSSPTFIFYY
uniref:NADH-ubiquinone oxidoreductase chain 2 n=1 Tax=Paramastax nigra TaxID=1260743 RepID=M4JDU2_9ORTH|nr:NADH dehydrogenase subunit 2 [Paramastax nigra]